MSTSSVNIGEGCIYQALIDGKGHWPENSERYCDCCYQKIETCEHLKSDRYDILLALTKISNEFCIFKRNKDLK